MESDKKRKANKPAKYANAADDTNNSDDDDDDCINEDQDAHEVQESQEGVPKAKKKSNPICDGQPSASWL